MTEIEERALHAPWRCDTKPLTMTSAHVVGYIQGATEQKAIDIEKACAWLKAYDITFTETPSMLEDFRRAMEGE